MKKAIVFLVTLVVFLTGCGANNVAENKSAPKDINNQPEATTERNLISLTKTEIDSNYSPTLKGNLELDKLNEWIPKNFEGKNQITKKWSHKLTSHSARNKTPTVSLPTGWLVNYGVTSDGNYFYHKLINPDNGELTDLQEENCGGPTNGEYVFGYSQIPAGQAICWKLDDKKVVWRGLIGYQDNKVCITNNTVISVISGDKSFVARGNPETGEAIWMLESNLRITDWCIAGTKIAIILDENELYSISIENGTFERLNTAKDPLSVASDSSKSIWVLTRDGIVQEIDIHKNVISRELALGSKEKGIKGQLSVGYSKLEKIGTKLLLKVSNGNKTNYLLIDVINFDIKEQIFGKVVDENDGNNFRAVIINNSLILENEKQIRGTNPDTLETIWWIDLDESMKNAHVEWLDWRGVLVVSNKEIACYNAIK